MGEGVIKQWSVVIEQSANVGLWRSLIIWIRDARGEQMQRDDIVGIEVEKPPKSGGRLVEPPGPAGSASEALISMDVAGLGLEGAREQRGCFLESSPCQGHVG